MNPPAASGAEKISHNLRYIINTTELDSVFDHGTYRFEFSL